MRLQIIECRNCKHWEELSNLKKGMCSAIDYATNAMAECTDPSGLLTAPNFYCALAEPKEAKPNSS